MRLVPALASQCRHRFIRTSKRASLLAPHMRSDVYLYDADRKG